MARCLADRCGAAVYPVDDGVSYLDQKFDEMESFPAYIGFTAATGADTNVHLVDALEVAETCP